MASDPSSSGPPKGILSSLGGNNEPEPDLLPGFDLPPPAVPVAQPADEAVPLALPVEPEPIPEALPVEAVPAETPAEAAAPVEPIPEALAPPAPPAPPPPCPVCGSAREVGQVSCNDCGYFFPDDLPIVGATPLNGEPSIPAAPAQPAVRVKTRYELGELLSEYKGIWRYRARDLGLSGTDNIPVVVVKQAAPAEALEVLTLDEAPAAETASEDEVMPGFDEPAAAVPVTAVLPQRPTWPGVAWERHLLDTLEHPGLPLVMDSFVEEGFEYLVEEVPPGRTLWDAWDAPETTNADRFTWLAGVAEIMQTLHRMGAMLEGIRPDVVVVNDQGAPRISDLSDLLPLPLPPDPPLRGRLYSSPELMTTPDKVDARADLYSFGAMIYALLLGRELTEREFLGPGSPKPVFNDYPDIHPALGRLLLKTFNRQVEARFPTDEAVKEDPTGFSELIRTLRVCARTLDTVRLEIAAWTTTGMIRTGNEDAFALLHNCESRQDDVAESALLLLADGMGGYEAGEVAATLALGALRKYLVAQKPFTALAGGSGFTLELPQGERNMQVRAEVDEIKQILKAALKDANKQVFSASRSGIGRRGMGCTAEVVYVDGHNVVVGHVGDSRTYHFSEGRLVQLTRDQTLVNRLVELGTLSEEEAETHPRRNELQQAVGGQPDVEPGIYSATLKPGDFIIVCSDGLSNHVKNAQFRQFLHGDDGVSADRAARRLMNLVNIEGATDNATVVVVRAT
jgi:serine/threonine protein phosphatase PrpC